MHGKPRRVVDLRCISKTRSSQALEGLPAGPQEHWVAWPGLGPLDSKARCRQQTRDRALEQSVLRRQQRGTWLLAAGAVMAGLASQEADLLFLFYLI